MVQRKALFLYVLKIYVGVFTSGEVQGSMDLTEPEAGSDLAAVRTRAVRDGAGWRVERLAP